ncbi:alpha/beta hydrolase fold protein [Kribbella flavida DSM 17836]|uniref:Alpha/beta hydrolase fold protein n=2 Tax=Kribbella flavida TaxID=182640 RepID=D2PL37_KRIFD|nr:alpha/beta hydrolase fold protein [Kribbella flavida DSM 17836]
MAALLLLLPAVVPLEARAAPAEPTWQDCRTGSGDAGAELDAADATCTTVRVPLDPLRPDGRTIDLAVSRIKADPAKRRGVLLVNPGGPGGPGIGYPAELKGLLGEVAAQYDLIGFDPRFTGRSAPIDCGPVRLADVFRSSPTAADFQASSRNAARFVAGCPRDGLRHASIRNTARDMDAIRAALGEEKISYYGVSWGADLGVVYSQLFPSRVDRMVVDSVTDVEGSEYHHLATGEQSEAAFDEWAAWAAWRDDTYHLGRSGLQIRTAVTRVLRQRKTLAIGDYRVDSAALPWLLQSALGDESDRDLMARNVRTVLDAAAGRRAEPSEELAGWLAQYYGTVPMISQFVAASVAYTCNDRGWPSDLAAYRRDLRNARDTQPLFAMAFLPCAYWTQHTTEPDLAIGNNVSMLIVQAERDNIPVRWARALHQKLPNSTLKTVDRRAHGVYDERVPSMVAAVNEYLGG